MIFEIYVKFPSAHSKWFKLLAVIIVPQLIAVRTCVRVVNLLTL